MDIFFDLDGPILDVSRRYYEVYRMISKALGLDCLSKSAYWSAKRHGLSNFQIIRQVNPEISEEMTEYFIEKWLQNVEDSDFLAMDRTIDNAHQVLKDSSTNHRCYLVTLRRKRRNLLKQLQQLELNPYFSKVLSSPGSSEGWHTKVKLIQRNVHGVLHGWIIGDSETDIKAGQQLGLVTCGVTYGIRNRTELSALSPDFLIDDLSIVSDILH